MSLHTSQRLSAFSRETSMHSRETSESLFSENKPFAIPVSNILLQDISNELCIHNPIIRTAFSMAELESFTEKYQRATRAAVKRVTTYRHTANSFAINQLFPQISDQSQERSPSPIQENDDGNSPLDQYDSPPRSLSASRFVSQTGGNSPFNQYGAPAALSSPEADLTDEEFEEPHSPEELTPWKNFISKPATPLKNRSVSRGDTLPPTPLAPFKATSPSKAAQHTYLPLVSDDAHDRWYRPSSNSVPGIIIDSHQSKHVCGNLFGPYRGARGNKFNSEDSTEEKIRLLLDHILNFTEFDFLNEMPKGNPPTLLSIAPGDKRFPYERIVISSIVFCPIKNSWCLHFYPDFHPRQ